MELLFIERFSGEWIRVWRWCLVLGMLDIRCFLDIEVKMLSMILDIKVRKEIWEGDKYLGVDILWIVFKVIIKGMSVDKEVF